jgi:hypothetical protein
MAGSEDGTEGRRCLDEADMQQLVGHPSRQTMIAWVPVAISASAPIPAMVGR